MSRDWDAEFRNKQISPSLPRKIAVMLQVRIHWNLLERRWLTVKREQQDLQREGTELGGKGTF